MTTITNTSVTTSDLNATRTATDQELIADFQGANGKNQFTRFGHHNAQNTGHSTTNYWSWATRTGGNYDLAYGTLNATNSNSSSNNVMSVTTDGYILTPNQPRFQAYISTNINFSALADNQVVDFQSATVNTGNHFSTSTHLFTAPVAGTYWFGVTLRVDGVGSTGSDYFHPYLGKNGTTGLESSLNGRLIVTAETQNIFSHISGSWIVQLAANDTMGLYHGDGNSAGVHAGSAYYQAGQCNFGGYLLA